LNGLPVPARHEAVGELAAMVDEFEF